MLLRFVFFFFTYRTPLFDDFYAKRLAAILRRICCFLFRSNKVPT